jgi:NADPH:quinone reductase-like Zn-dependent oxidoreductase
MRALISRERGEDIEVLAEMIAAGTVTPVVERTFPLADAADAIRHLDAGRARGKVVVTV